MSLTNLFINLILNTQITEILDWLILVFITHGKKINSAYDKNRFKVSAPTWNDEFELPDGSYSISGIQDYFELIIKTGYKLELLSPETMKLLGSAKKDGDKDNDGEDVPKLEFVEIVLVHCNLVNNSYQKACKVLLTLVPNK